MHSTLLYLGFQDHVEKLRKRGETGLFSELKRGRDGYGQAVSWWFSRYKESVGIYDKKKCFHSFRHTVIDFFNHAEVNERVAKSITGHTDGSKSYGRYGDGYKPKILKDVIEVLDFKLPKG